jgi:hypothetical protein
MKPQYIVLGLLFSAIACETVFVSTKVVSLKKECQSLVNNYDILKQTKDSYIKDLKIELADMKEQNSEKIYNILDDIDYITDEFMKDLEAIKLEVVKERPVTIIDFLFNRKFRGMMWSLRKMYHRIDKDRLLNLLDDLKEPILKIKKSVNP